MRAVHALAVMEHWRATASPAGRALAWSREFADHSSGSGLLNTAGCRAADAFMGHLQGTVLVETASVLGHSEFIEFARPSAEVLLLPRSQIQLRFRTRAAV
jgi:hypothetical protein